LTSIVLELSPFKHILIVDASPDDRARMLQEVRSVDPGVIVSEARSLSEFDDLLSEQHIDLVITDYELNGSSGLDVLTRAKQVQPECSVIMFTASGSEEIAVSAMKNGLHDYILKSPANFERLRTSIRQLFVESKQHKTLETAQHRYQELFQDIPIGLYQTSPDGTFMEVNQAMVTMLGYPDAETLKRVATKELYVHKDHFQQWKRQSTELGYVKGLEVEMWRYDRSVIWVEINGKPVYKDGVFQFNEGSVQDITGRIIAVRDLKSTASHAALLAKRNAELYAQLQKHSRHLEETIEDRTREYRREVQIRKKSEEDLLISRSSYKAVVDRVREAICKLDEDGVIRFINPGWEQITGYDIASSLGKEFIQFFDAQTVESIKNQLRSILTTSSSQINMLVPFVTGQGQQRWIEIYFDADKNITEEVIGLFVMMFDVTDRKLANDEISKAYVKEKELNELRAQFVSMTSHEFRTPLASIMTSSELLQHYGNTWPSEKNDVHHRRIQSAVKHIISLMDDVLIIGKSEAGKLVCEKQPEQVCELTRAMIEEIELIGKGTHTLVFDGPEVDSEVWLDRKLYRQIVTNLVTNALKYSPKGSTVYVSLKVDSEYISLMVKDEGIGIHESDIRQLFQPFFRAKNVRDTPGTGLGMPIVKRSVDAHNGSVQIDSKENVGTLVTVNLDIKKPN